MSLEWRAATRPFSTSVRPTAQGVPRDDAVSKSIATQESAIRDAGFLSSDTRHQSCPESQVLNPKGVDESVDRPSTLTRLER